MKRSNLIVGLGNPGRRYLETPHNLGFRILDLLAEKIGAEKERVSNKKKFDVRKGNYEGVEVWLLKPMTYMNLSGEAVESFLRFLGDRVMDSDRIIAICDDVYLPLGVIRLRMSGGSGGHKGLISIANHLGSNEFGRLRVGIGQPASGIDYKDFVLEKITGETARILGESEQRSVEALQFAVEHGTEAAMNIFNRKPPLSDSIQMEAT